MKERRPATHNIQKPLEIRKDLLTPIEAAQYLGVSRWTVYRWVQEGRLEATKIGKNSLRIFSRSIQKLIEENTL
jgi:excisionase family DNA binding protein